MIELPEVVGWTSYLTLGFALMFSGLIFAIMLSNKYKFTASITSAMLGIGLGVIIIISYHQPLADEYNNQMKELISSTECENLDYIREERPRYNGRVINEIISRCIPGEHIPELLKSIRGND